MRFLKWVMAHLSGPRAGSGVIVLAVLLAVFNLALAPLMLPLKCLASFNMD
jgi:hypothetical protein